MAQFSTKLKIILIVFGVIAGLYVIQFFVTSVANSSKRESFENDEDDDEAPNEKPKKKVASKESKKDEEKEAMRAKIIKESYKEKKEDDDDEEDKPKKKNASIIDKEIKLNVLEQVENVFDKMYPNSDKKPLIFDMLMNKEHFEELKAKHENGESMGKYIKKVIQQTMSNIEEDKIDQFKEEDARPIDTILEKLDETESKQKLMSQLEDVVTKISHIQNELKKLGVDAVDIKPEKPKNDKSKKDLIEGFENRINYASY